MRIVNFLLALLALMMAAGAGAYAWWTMERQIIANEQLVTQVELEREKRLRQYEIDLAKQILDIGNTQSQLSRRMEQLEQQQRTALAAATAQLQAVEEDLAKINQSLQQADYSWLLENIAGTLEVTERAVYLRQSASISNGLLDKILLLINRLPPAQATRLGNALQQDLQQISPAILNDDLPGVSRRIDEVETLIGSLPQACCDDFAPTPAITDANASLWQRLLGLLNNAVRLTRVEDNLMLQPNQYERSLLRAGLGMRLAQARGALWNYDQTGWQNAWAAFLADATRVMPHDPQGLAGLRTVVEEVAALSVEPVTVRFEQTWRALELAR